MKTFKKLMPILFVLAVIVVMLVVTCASVSAETYSGTCGDDLTWNLDDSGVLTISGTGDMNDYDKFSESNHVPWTSYKGLIKSVVIGDYVTGIDGFAFENCSSLESVSIGNSVTTIGGSAFYGCTSLTSVTIPDSVENMGDYAFYGCTALASVTIPDSVTSIGFRAFVNTAYYKDPDNWTNDVLYIGNHLIEAETSLSGSCTVKNGTLTIAKAAFYNCTSLASVTIPDSVTIIGENSFQNCYSLTSVTIPDSVTSIGGSAFEYCYSLNSINIPESVTSIGGSAFYGCTSLTNVNIPGFVTIINNYTFGLCSSLTTVTIPDSVSGIGGSAFELCRSLTSVTIPDSVTKIGEGAFMFCDNLTVHCNENSYAHKYSIENNIKFELLNDSAFDNHFTDIKESHWFYSSVEFVLKKGYMKGMSDTTFSPNSNITREQFVLILANIAGVDTNEFKTVSSGFTDVPTGQWYSGAVTWAVNEGYVSGMSADKFGRGQSIQRAALARMLYNYASANGIDVTGRADLSGFGDAADFDKAGNAWMKEPVQWAVENGIISGMTVNGKNCVNAKGTATRAQAARMLMQFDELIK